MRDTVRLWMQIARSTSDYLRHKEIMPAPRTTLLLRSKCSRSLHSEMSQFTHCMPVGRSPTEQPVDGSRIYPRQSRTQQQSQNRADAGWQYEDEVKLETLCGA